MIRVLLSFAEFSTTDKRSGGTSSEVLSMLSLVF